MPYFRALLRAVESKFYQNIQLPAPVLDIGCGDGHFASIVFDNPIDVGIDPIKGSICLAARRGGYQSVIQADGGDIPFPKASFNSAVSNSVLEHIPNVEKVLEDIGRVLKPGALFVFCVPNQNFLPSLSIGKWLDQLGMKFLGNSYRSFFNRIARHYHCDPPSVWQTRLESAGFSIEKWWNYYSPAAMRVTEWGHYFGLPSLIIHKFTGRWVLVPNRWNLIFTYRLIEKYYKEIPECEDGVCSFYITRRIGRV